MIKIAFTCILSITALSGQQTNFKFLQGMGDVRYHQVDSQILGRPFHLYVRLPDSYDPGKAYPTIYLLDGGSTFPILSVYLDNITEPPIVPSIVVGISYGTHGRGNYRGVDFTAPAASRSSYGGAPKFQQVLRSEIIPVIEQTYRSDPSRRIIFGHSLGGQFVLYTAQTRPDLFWGYIASNPALHRNVDFFLNTQPESAPSGNRPRLFVGGAADEEQRYQVARKAWVKRWTAQKSRPWALKTVVLENHTHMSSRPESFRQGMQWLFNDQL